MALASFRVILAVLFGLAGVIHLARPTFFLPVMPPFIPFPLVAILVSGGAEILGGLGLLVPAPAWVRPAAAWGLIALLLAVFPVNIYMALASDLHLFGLPPHSWVYWARLPLQFVLLWAVAVTGGLWRGR